MLKVTSLKAGYGGIVALKGVDLSVATGQMVALIGANGAGKSTLVNTLSGLVRASEGSVIFQDKELTHTPAYMRVRAGLLQVPEGRQVLGPMSVEENLQLGRLARASREGTTYELSDIFQLFPVLKERRNQAAGSLSGGEQQMLAIGRALMGQPSLLLLDEPSLGLSPLMVKTVFRTLSELNANGLTILLIEQNARMALQIADYAYVLERGRVTIEGEAAALTDDQRVVEHYLGL